jgi:hypothetical protein
MVDAVVMKDAVPIGQREIGLGKAGPGRGNKTDDTARFTDRGAAYLAPLAAGAIA